MAIGHPPKDGGNVETLRSKEPIARKEYWCDASEYVRESLSQTEFTYAEYREIVKAKRQGWKIKAGQKYVKQVQADGGEIITYRAIPAMNDLCNKYDLFPDW